MNKLYINTDGGSRGNPGPAGIGIVFSNEEEKVVYRHKEYIGEKTNNEAEYTALLRAVEILSKSNWLKENSGKGEVVCRLDSQLVIEQICGNYKIKQPHLMMLSEQVIKETGALDVKISFVYIPREQNKLADKLVNEALDLAIKGKKS